jgi:hypothetical protein
MARTPTMAAAVIVMPPVYSILCAESRMKYAGACENDLTAHGQVRKKYHAQEEGAAPADTPGAAPQAGPGGAPHSAGPRRATLELYTSIITTRIVITTRIYSRSLRIIYVRVVMTENPRQRPERGPSIWANPVRVLVSAPVQARARRSRRCGGSTASTTRRSSLIYRPWSLRGGHASHNTVAADCRA